LSTGEVPDQKYPLVSKPPIAARKCPLVLQNEEWINLRGLADEEGKCASAEDEEDLRLAEASEELKRSWGQEGKGKVSEDEFRI